MEYKAKRVHQYAGRFYETGQVVPVKGEDSEAMLKYGMVDKVYPKKIKKTIKKTDKSK